VAIAEDTLKILNVIGAGLIGLERMKAVQALQKQGHALKIGRVLDPYQPNLPSYAATYGFTPIQRMEEMLDLPCDLLVIACPHDIATEVACNALRKGHNVLLEKPMGRSLAEAEAIERSAAEGKGQLRLGVNYRFMPGPASLRQDLKENRFGSLISVNIKMGHGGKSGDERTWKLDPVRCGGGALLDPGVHLLDMIRYLLGAMPTIVGSQSWSGFWRTGIEEEVHIMGHIDSTLIGLQVSVVSWLSTFEVIVLGTEGYGRINGRGRSYGPQIYRRGLRWGWRGGKSQIASEEEIVNDPCEGSFADEMATILGFEPMIEGTTVELLGGLELMRFYDQCRKSIIVDGNAAKDLPKLTQSN